MNRTSVVNGSWNDLLLYFVSLSSPWAYVWPVIFFIWHFGIPELFSFLTTVFLASCGWSNSSRDTDPSAVSSFSCFSWLCLWFSFPLEFSCTKCLKLACQWQWGKTDCFSSFPLVASPDIVWTTWRGTFPQSLWQTFWRWLVWFSHYM